MQTLPEFKHVIATSTLLQPHILPFPFQTPKPSLVNVIVLAPHESVKVLGSVMPGQQHAPLDDELTLEPLFRLPEEKLLPDTELFWLDDCLLLEMDDWGLEPDGPLLPEERLLDELGPPEELRLLDELRLLELLLDGGLHVGFGRFI